MTDVVIAAYRRSPFHFAHKGELVKLRPDEMAAQVARALVAQSGVDPETIEDMIVGCAFPEGEQVALRRVKPQRKKSCQTDRHHHDGGEQSGE